ncbi:MAG: hypothetical protein ACFFC7_00220 [Candidatus Hermodarchaeota archaeon]
MHKFRQIWQKNIFLTIITFFVGMALQLSEITIISLVIGVAIVSTWWQWRPHPINAESKLILDSLKKYPAVLIKNYSHIIAFNSKLPHLAAAYQSPVPRGLLKRHLIGKMELIEGLETAISQVDIEVFLLLKIPLTPYTKIKRVFQNFQSLIDILELHLQAKFELAERYQTIRLFGLESHVKTTQSPKTRPIAQIMSDSTINTRLKQQPGMVPENAIHTSFLCSKSGKQMMVKDTFEQSELFGVVSIGEEVEEEIRAVFARNLSFKECQSLSLAIGKLSHLFHSKGGARFQEPLRIPQTRFYLLLFELSPLPKKHLVWLCVHEIDLSKFIENYNRIYSVLETFLGEVERFTYEDLRTILEVINQLLKRAIKSKTLVNTKEVHLRPKKVGRLPVLFE